MFGAKFSDTKNVLKLSIFYFLLWITHYILGVIWTYKNYYEKNRSSNTKIEIPFEIKSGWQWCHLGDLFDVVSASRVHQSDWKKQGIPFYRAREIAKLAEFGHVNNELFISEELFRKFSRNGFPEKGDLMITAVGTLGKVYIVKEGDLFYYKDASVISLKNYFLINPSYISRVFESDFLLNQIKDNSYGTTVGTITIERAKKYLIPLPPEPEQKRMLLKIDQIFNQIN